MPDPTHLTHIAVANVLDFADIDPNDVTKVDIDLNDGAVTVTRFRRDSEGQLLPTFGELAKVTTVIPITREEPHRG